MGKYINVINGKALGASCHAKCDKLIEAGAIPTTGNKFEKDLICVVDNGHFAAAGYCYDKEEFEAFNHPLDDRPKYWFILKDAESYID